MDNGHSKSWKRINKYLQKEVKSKSLDLYISHNHGDHIGAYKKLFEAYKVNTVYLSYAEYTLFIEEKDKKKKTNLVDIFLNAAKGTKSEGPTIKYLSYTAKANANSPTSKFYIGNATVTIIGAIVNKKLEKTKGTNAYENNMSLVAKVKGGGMTYLSCGDIQENSAKNNKTGGQELILAGSNNTSVLKADIMKLSHHGIRKPVKGKYMLSNSTDILELVKPKISFIQTKGNMDTLEHKKEEASSANEQYLSGEQSRKNASKYGFCYPLDYEKKHLVIKCQNGKAKISRGEIKNGFKRMKGFVTLKIKRNKKVKKIWTLSTYKETHYISPATGAGAVNKWAIKKKYDSNGYYCHLDGSGVKDEKTAIYMSTNSNVVKNADAKNKKIKDKWINIKVTTKYICQYHIKNGVKVGKARYLDSESNIIKDKWITIEKRKECVYQFHIINGIKVGTQYYSKAKKATKKPQC